MKANKRRRESAPSAETPAGAATIFGVSAWLYAIPAALGLIFAFGESVRGPFIFDDYHLPFNDPHAVEMGARFWIGGVRPLLMVTYWANFLLSGTNPESYHIVNLILHLTATALFFLILRRLGAFLPASPGWSPWFGAGLFLLHPLQTESVDYVAGRSEILCAIFVFMAWLLFLHYFDTRLPVIATVGILLCCAAAVLSKESGVCVWGLMVCSDFYWNRQGVATQLRRKAALYLTGLAGLPAAVFLIFRMLSNSSTAGFGTGVTPWAYALTQCRSILIYLRLFFWPAGQNLNWRLPMYHSVWQGGAWPYALALMTLLAGVCFFYSRLRVFSFGVALFLVALAPTSSFVPVQDNLAERRMYLPLAGLIIAVLGVAAQTPVGTRMRNAVFTLLLAAVALVSQNRSHIWSDERLMWRNVIAQDPGNAQAHSWLAGVLAMRGDCGGAAVEYKTSADLDGLTLANGTNLATAYECSKQPERALATWRELVKIHPAANAYNRIGYLEAINNNIQPSLDAFDAALRLDPNNATAYAYRGTANMALRKTAAAKEDFLRAIALDPGNAIAAAGLGRLGTEPRLVKEQ